MCVLCTKEIMKLVSASEGVTELKPGDKVFFQLKRVISGL